MTTDEANKVLNSYTKLISVDDTSTIDAVQALFTLVKDLQVRVTEKDLGPKSAPKEAMVEDEYFTLEYSRKGEDDWYATGGQNMDSLKRAREERARFIRAADPGFDYRIVKKTVTAEVVE